MSAPIVPDRPFELSESDKRSPTWDALKKYIAKRLDADRIRNDGSLDAVETAHVRGRIAFAKSLLALDKDT